MLISSHFQLLRDLLRCCIFFDQPEDCLNRGTTSTDGITYLEFLRGKLAIFQLVIREGFKKDVVIMF